jgi:hypothetical protein
VQDTFPLGTRPSVVGELKVQLTVSTTVPGGCSTVIVALVNATSVIVSVQLVPGHSGAPGMGDVGAFVVTGPNGVLPFLISEPGIDCVPVSVTEAGFRPGGCCFPEGLVQTAVGFPVAVNVTATSPLPSPARFPASSRQLAAARSRWRLTLSLGVAEPATVVERPAVLARPALVRIQARIAPVTLRLSTASSR